MLTRLLRTIMALLAIIVGLYPVLYFIVDRNFGLLQSKPAALLTSIAWNTGFYIHIITGGIALLIGWIQFIEKFRNRRLSLHRTIGKIYVITALSSSIAAIYIAFYATGGIIASSGFMLLGLTWFYTTATAYTSIRNRNLKTHQVMMIYSYACCLAAVTLRIYLPLLTMAFGDFIPAYLTVAWLCWVPNMAVAYLIVKKLKAGNQITYREVAPAVHNIPS
jgi:uncharacterized membrane protein